MPSIVLFSVCCPGVIIFPFLFSKCLTWYNKLLWFSQECQTWLLKDFPFSSFDLCQQFSVFLNIELIIFPTVLFCSSVLFEGSICPNVYSFTNNKRSIESICAQSLYLTLALFTEFIISVILTISIPACYTENVTMIVPSSKCSSTFSVSFVKIFFYLCATLKMNSFWKIRRMISVPLVRILATHLRQILERNMLHTHTLMLSYLESDPPYCWPFLCIMNMSGLDLTTHFRNLRKS